MNSVPRLLALLLTFLVAGCDLIGDIFQAGLVVGIIVVLLLVALIGWVIRKMRGGPRGPAA